MEEQIKNELIRKVFAFGFNSYFGLMVAVNKGCYHLWMEDFKKLLREKYDIHIQLHYDASIEQWEYRLYLLNEYIYDSTNNKVIFNADLHYDSYEDALEAGLLEALKLIK